MRCATIALDIDGVVVDLVSAVLPLLSSECGRQVHQEDIKCYNIGKALGIEDKMYDMWPRIYQSDILAMAPPITGAIDGLIQLQDHRIIFVTSRPESTKHLTESWFDKHGVKYAGLHFAADGNKGIQGQVIEVLVEDSLEQVVKASEAGIETILLDHPWNKSTTLPPLCHRVYDWGGIVKSIKYLIGKNKDEKEA